MSTCSETKKYDIVVVGGGPGGTTAALTARIFYRDKSVLLIKNVDRPLIPCAIPYTIATIDSPAKILGSYASLKSQGIELVTDNVVDIDRGRKTVVTASGACYEYDKLVLATGSVPSVPPIDGADLRNVVVVSKRFEDVERMHKTLREANRVAIVGCGFIGVELADELIKLGKKVFIVEILSHCLLLNFDEEFAVKAEEELRKLGVTVITGRTVKRIYGSEAVEGIELDNGDRIEVDAVVIATGHRPNTELAKKAGLELGRYGVLVDDRMRTSDPNIFAVGDVAEKKHFLLNEPIPLMLSSIACQEARVAAANLYRDSSIRMDGAIGVVLTRVGDLVVGCAGTTESLLKRRAVDYVVGRSTAVNRHPFFLRGACSIELKLVFLNDGTLVGAEAAGYCNEVAEIINALAIAIQKKMRIEDLIALRFGSQPTLTAAPTSNPVVLAALDALKKIQQV